MSEKVVQLEMVNRVTGERRRELSKHSDSVVLFRIMDVVGVSADDSNTVVDAVYAYAIGYARKYKGTRFDEPTKNITEADIFEFADTWDIEVVRNKEAGESGEEVATEKVADKKTPDSKPKGKSSTKKS